jgi:hypothetical protein
MFGGNGREVKITAGGVAVDGSQCVVDESATVLEALDHVG